MTPENRFRVLYIKKKRNHLRFSQILQFELCNPPDTGMLFIIHVLTIVNHYYATRILYMYAKNLDLNEICIFFPYEI